MVGTARQPYGGARAATASVGRRPGTAAALAAGAASGVLLWLASPAVGAGWLAWVALTPAALVALADPHGRAGRLAVPLAVGVALELMLVPALPFGVAEGQWGEPPVPIIVGDSPVLVVALVLVPAFAALLHALRFGQAWIAWPARGARAAAAAVLVPALAFAALDVVRLHLDPGGGWGPLLLTQHALAPGALAALAGPWLVSLAVAASGYALALGALRGRRTALAAAAAVAAAVGGATALAAALDDGGGRALTVAAVQPGYDTSERERPQLRHFRRGSYDRAALDVIADLRPLTIAAAERGARVVVWPEAVAWVDVPRHGATLRAVAGLARDARVAIVVPFFDRDRRWNAALTVGPDGRPRGAQPKQRPMWFLGEDGGNRRPAAPADAGPARVGTLLGVDTHAPDVGRALAAADAALLASATHDWPALARQQRALTRVQARAAGLPVVRADWRYGSAIYRRDGSVAADAGLARRRTVLVARVELAGRETPYVRAGTAPAWLAVATAALAGAAGARARRRRRR